MRNAWTVQPEEGGAVNAAGIADRRAGPVGSLCLELCANDFASESSRLVGPAPPAPPAPPAVRTNSYRHGFPPSLEIVQMIQVIQVIQMMQLLILLLPIGRGPHRYSIGRRTLPYGSTHPLLLPMRHCTELAAHLSQPCRDPRLVHHATARYRHSEPGRRTRG
jgi:hypothetical protein